MKFIFKLSDFWVGIFFDYANGYVYFFPLPCIGIRFSLLPPGYTVRKVIGDYKYIVQAPDGYAEQYNSYYRCIKAAHGLYDLQLIKTYLLKTKAAFEWVLIDREYELQPHRMYNVKISGYDIRTVSTKELTEMLTNQFMEVEILKRIEI